MIHQTKRMLLTTRSLLDAGSFRRLVIRSHQTGVPLVRSSPGVSVWIPSLGAPRHISAPIQSLQVTCMISPHAVQTPSASAARDIVVNYARIRFWLGFLNQFSLSFSLLYTWSTLRREGNCQLVVWLAWWLFVRSSPCDDDDASSL